MINIFTVILNLIFQNILFTLFVYYSMSPEERYAYDEHLNAIMIQRDVLSAAKLEGLEEGRIEQNKENARSMKALGLSPETIRQVTGLSLEEIEQV